jgi:hypothetical protein
MAKSTKKNSLSNDKKVEEIKEVIVETEDSDLDSDIESDDSDIESEVSEEPEVESEEEKEDEKNKESKDKKDKLKKYTHKELTSELISNEEKIGELKSKLVEHEDAINTITKEINAIRRTNLRFIKLLDKAHDEDVTKARKEKKKRNITQNSGILKNKPIPPILIKFLDIKSDVTELPRTKVMSLLNNKFKELGLKKGQETVLDKPTAKLFGKEEGFTIEFKYFQTFLKNVYEESEGKSNEVSL